jgi:hypothetical protein
MTSPEFAKGDECFELLIPFVHNIPGWATADTIWPPGHIQKLCTAEISRVDFTDSE